MAGTELESLLQDCIQKGASDLHLLHGSPPIYRISGQIVVTDMPQQDSGSIWSMLLPYFNDRQQRAFQDMSRINISVTAPTGRFRVNLCMTLGTVSASIRVVPSKIYPLSALGLPPIVGSLTQKTRGIIFVTGATGNGKSTTMAAMLDHINRSGNRPGKVVTIEDPIETLFKPAKCVFLQREVGVDTPSFDLGIEDALRQDPDILCIGEMRTPESIRAALMAAETGHLVLTTLHTPDAAKTAQRVISMFPGNEQETIRDQLCNTLEAVISQDLITRADGKGRILAIEVMLAVPAVRQLIKKGNLEQIYDLLQTGTSQGMISKDASIKALYQRSLISRESALSHMRNPQLLA
ncbi:MAG: PilT/PilU family type 4a pilus ATPase [Elusimicrobiota bacterium]